MNRHAKASSAGSTLRRAGGLASFALLVLLAALALAPAANAALLVELGKLGSGAGEAGGQSRSGEAVAVNRSGAGGVEAGDVYVADVVNSRIQEFSKNGAFVRTWGQDVIKAGEPNDTGAGFEICEVASECKAGVNGAEAGAFSAPDGVAVDQDTGNVYVTEANNRRVDVFSAKGLLEGAFGWNVKATGGAEELQLCTSGSGCQAGGFTGGAGGFGSLDGAIAVNPTNGDLWVGDSFNHRINEFAFTLNGSEEVTGVEFVRALGWDVNATSPAEELQACTTATGCQEGTAGAGSGQLGVVRDLAIDASGAIYAVSNSFACEASTPCRVEKFNPDGSFAEDFGPSSGGEAGCQLSWSAGGFENGNPIEGAFSDPAYGIAIDPANQHVFITRRLGSAAFVQVKTLDICEFDSEGTLLQRSPVSPVRVNLSGGQKLAIGSEEHIYLGAPDELGSPWPTVTIYGYVPAAPATLLATTEITSTSATLNGEVTVPKPGGTGFNVRYRFEYSPDNGLTWLRAPAFTDASVGTTTPGSYPVQQKISGLLPNNTYRVRLVTSTSFVTLSEEKSFTTPVGAPVIGEIRARDAAQNAVTLEAKVNPAGSPTTYRFEWGPTSAYGNQVPADYEPFVGSGHEGAQVTAKLTGLSAGATYHYRVVAHNAGGTTASPDRTAETLNSCGLPEDRCFELVSRKEAGPVSLPGKIVSPLQLHFQAAPSGPGALAYIVEAGYPDSTTGGEVLYSGKRGPSGWESTQLAPAITGQNEANDGGSNSGINKWLSRDLSCGFISTRELLTDDPATRYVHEYGGYNLYRNNPDGSYTAVTDLPPENADDPNTLGDAFAVVGASSNCSKVFFFTRFSYPGLQGLTGGFSQTNNLYEWDEGALRNANVIPGPSGEVVVSAIVGGETSGIGVNGFNAVSEDGSRIFITAERLTSPNPEEIGKQGLFVREGGTTRDVSLSETSTPDKAATYQWATPDGSKVFFTANAGLTEESSPEGIDLYEYDLETEKLTDLTPYDGEGGAQVAGFVGASEDGSHVYLATPAQLVPGKGNTLAQNRTDEALSIYGESGGQFAYVGSIGKSDGDHVFSAIQGEWTSRVSHDGRYLLFQSSRNVTGYDSGGTAEAYLYDAAGDSGGTICVSCRQDGQPSVAPGRYEPLPVGQGGQSAQSIYHPPQFLITREGKPHVFFSSPDVLAPGAVESQNNVYEWSHDQVFRLSSSRKGQQSPEPIGGFENLFAGSSDDGSDVYLATPETLNWEDGDERVSVYDARVGGGFPEPAAPPAPCEATSEGPGSCQGPAQGAPAVGGAASAAFNGPGNPPAKAPKQKKSKKKPHKKKQKHAKKKGSGKKARHANGNRRAGK